VLHAGPTLPLGSKSKLKAIGKLLSNHLDRFVIQKGNGSDSFY